MDEFSSEFVQPKPPKIKAQYKAHFVQHKWSVAQYDVYCMLLTAKFRNAELSHITAGYIENSPSKGFVRVDEAYDGELATSHFNYANVTKSGLVDNTLTTYDHKHTKPNVWRGYVNSNFPIFGQDILVKAEAVYQGLVKRDFISSPVAAVSITMFRNMALISLTPDLVEHYVSRCNTCNGVCQ